MAPTALPPGNYLNIKLIHKETLLAKLMCSQQRGSRVFLFSEQEWSMKSWIIQEDLTRKYQEVPTEYFKEQTHCSDMKPPRP